MAQQIQKFCLIADSVTYLVIVAGKEPSDLLVEQGLLLGTTEFFAKSHVLKWVQEDEEHPLRLDAGRRVQAVRPGRTAVSLANRGGNSSTRRKNSRDGGRNSDYVR